MTVVWCVPQDVQNLTGEIATESEIAQAQAIVDTFASVNSAKIQIGVLFDKDLDRLRKATAYQTVFMQQNPGLFGRQNVKGVSQDGVSAQYEHEEAVILAPLARFNIMRLRWKRGRALHPRWYGRQGILELQQTWPRDAEPGGEFGWTPMGR